MAQLTRDHNVELIVSEVNVLASCCSCGEGDGVLRCSGCKAVTYCGKDCQENGWNDHKQICGSIHQLLQEVEAAIEALEKEYGGVEALLEAPLVKDGLFRFRDQHLSREDQRNFWFDNNQWPTLSEKYDIARWKLIDAYAKCGKEASSKLAFRLAAENLIHMLWLSRGTGNQDFLVLDEDTNRDAFTCEETWHKYCGWMVAGDMDQKALDYIGYIQSEHPRTTPYFDLSVEEDIEGLSVVKRVKEKVIPHPVFTPRFRVHDFMLIALIKYKRIKALSVLRKGEEESWNTFLEGTWSRDGESSVVLISGMAPVLEKLKGLVMDKSIDKRIYLLTNQVNDLLSEVDEGNPKLIPGVLDRHVQMVDNPVFQDEDIDELKDMKESQSHYGFSDFIPPVEKEVHIARFAVRKYGYAWHIENDCTRALKLFLESGNVMTGEADTSPQTLKQNADEAVSHNRERDEENNEIKHLSGKVEEDNDEDVKDFSGKAEEDNDNEVKDFNGKVEEDIDKDVKDFSGKAEEDLDKVKDFSEKVEEKGGGVIVDDKDKTKEPSEGIKQESK